MISPTFSVVERRVRRRFQDHRVARVERRHERPERQVHGRVPRRDDADDAERPVAQLDVLVVVVGEHLDGNLDADHAVRLRGAAVDLGDGLRERLALLARQELGELVLPLAQPLRELLHERGTLRERARAPGGKRAARGGDGAVELARGAQPGSARTRCRAPD